MNKDIKYFRQKYENALLEKSPMAEKYRKQLELLEDAAVIYRRSKTA